MPIVQNRIVKFEWLLDVARPIAGLYVYQPIRQYFGRVINVRDDEFDVAYDNVWPMVTYATSSWTTDVYPVTLVGVHS